MLEIFKLAPCEVILSLLVNQTVQLPSQGSWCASRRMCAWTNMSRKRWMISVLSFLLPSDPLLSSSHLVYGRQPLCTFKLLLSIWLLTQSLLSQGEWCMVIPPEKLSTVTSCQLATTWCFRFPGTPSHILLGLPLPLASSQPACKVHVTEGIQELWDCFHIW